VHKSEVVVLIRPAEKDSLKPNLHLSERDSEEAKENSEINKSGIIKKIYFNKNLIKFLEKKSKLTG